jgi:hypothetical protein
VPSPPLLLLPRLPSPRPRNGLARSFVSPLPRQHSWMEVTDPCGSYQQGTAYTPVSLPAPKKLANRWGAGAVLQESASSSPPASSKPVLNRWGSGATSSTPGAAAGPAPTEGKKLTWSERQALAKARDAEEEQRSKAGQSAAS